MTGRAYSAEDPETLLWVHCVEVHSFLAAYRAYGGTRLTAEEQDRYLAESAAMAALVGIPEARVPRSREEMRRYFAAVLPSLCLSQAALEAIRFVSTPPITRKRLAFGTSLRIVSSAAIGLVPRHLRALAGIDRGPLADLATYAGVRAATLPLSVALELPFAERANLERLRRFVAERPFAPVPADARTHAP